MLASMKDLDLMIIGLAFGLVILHLALKRIYSSLRSLTSFCKRRESSLDSHRIFASDVFSQQLQRGFINRLIRLFKRSYRHHGKFLLKGQVPHLARLAEFYHLKYRKSGRWTDCLKAHALYNSVAQREPYVTSWKERVFEVQQEYWNEDVSLGYNQQQDLTKSLKNELEFIRKKTLAELETEVTSIDNFQYPITPRDELDTFSTSVKNISLICSEDMANFAGRIIRETVATFSTLPPPCTFVAVAIGSLARGEATPYSDLEYFFLVDNKTGSSMEYFERLAINTYFQIGNLGETKLDYMAIKELAGWFEDCSQNGFKIDGLKKHAGNIPTGNGSSNAKNCFIVTPQELADRYKIMLDNPDEEKAVSGDLTAMLTFMKPIYSHQKRKVDLLSELKAEIKSMIFNAERERINMLMLVNDISKFDLRLNIPLEENGFAAHVKKEFYRFPSIILLDIIIITKVMAESSWESLNSLLKDDKISADFYHVLQFVLAAASYMRLSTYLFHNSQDDRVSVARGVSDRQSIFSSNRYDKPHMRWFIPDKLFTTMCSKLVLLKNTVTGNAIDLSTVKLDDDDAWSRVNVLFYSGRYEDACAVMETIFGHSMYDDPLSVTQYLPQGESMHNMLSIVSSTLMFCKNYRIALVVLEHMANNRNDFERHKTVKCHIGLGNFKEAFEILDSFKNKTATADHYRLLGEIYRGLKKYQQSESALLQALDMEYLSHTSLDQQYDQLGNPLRVNCQSELHKRYDYFGDTISTDEPSAEPEIRFRDMKTPEERLPKIIQTSRRIIIDLELLAMVYREQERKPLALAYFKKCQQLASELYGKGAAVGFLCDLSLQIGHTYITMGKYIEADCYLRDALSICERIAHYGNKVSLMCEMAKNLRSLGDYQSSQAYYKRALATVRKRSRKDAVHEIACLLHELGRRYTKMGCFDEARDYLRQALEKHRELSHGVESVNTAKTMLTIGYLYQQFNLDSKAECFFRQALSIYRDSSSGDYRLETAGALLYMFISNMRTGRILEAYDHYQQALALLGFEGSSDDIRALKSPFEVMEFINKLLSALGMEKVGVGCQM